MFQSKVHIIESVDSITM